jgi:DNA gyrase/topoisomerase IV subunit B
MTVSTCCFKEIVDNAVDEFHEGWGKVIDITLNEETKEVSVRDYGRGIPFGKLARCCRKDEHGQQVWQGRLSGLRKISWS